MPLRFRLFTCVCTLALGAIALPGCAGGGEGPFTFSSGNGNFVGDESLSRIRPGETDVEWVLAVLGRPQERKPLSGGAEEIWKYQYQSVAGGGSRSFLINSRTEKGQNARYIYIQLAGGIVSDWWRD